MMICMPETHSGRVHIKLEDAVDTVPKLFSFFLHPHRPTQSTPPATHPDTSQGQDHCNLITSYFLIPLYITIPSSNLTLSSDHKNGTIIVTLKRGYSSTSSFSALYTCSKINYYLSRVGNVVSHPCGCAHRLRGFATCVHLTAYSLVSVLCGGDWEFWVGTEGLRHGMEEPDSGGDWGS
jgi:hypothetical protein